MPVLLVRASSTVDERSFGNGDVVHAATREPRQLFNVTWLNVTSLVAAKANVTGDPSRVSERVIGSVLISSSVALTLLAVALALFAGLAPFGFGSRRKKRSNDVDSTFSPIFFIGTNANQTRSHNI
jgi:hypothetical protein